MNINKIITESINKIIVENIQFQFQQLGGRYTRLQQYRNQIKRTDLTSTGNQQIISFIGHEFYNFITALEQAIKRCINAGNINESFADYGIEIPGEINVWNNAQKYYYNTKNMLTGRNGYNSVNQYSNKKPIKTNRNEKLLYLLDTVWPQIQNKFIVLHNQYNFNTICPAVIGAKDEIENIIQIVKNIRNQNAQGTNP